MGLLDIQTALGRLVRAPDGRDPFRSLHLDASERAALGALTRSPGFQFTVGVQRSWCVARTMNGGSLTLSILPEDLRRTLLDEWTNAGGGTSSFFAAEADRLLDFIARRLPYPSHELTACRLEQATLRANDAAALFTPPGSARLNAARCVLRRGRHAGIVFFHGEPEQILDALLEHNPLPPVSPHATPILFGPGLDRLCRPAELSEVELWEELTAPVAFVELLTNHSRRDAVEAMLRAGAIEYVEPSSKELAQHGMRRDQFVVQPEGACRTFYASEENS